jgi:predicted nucleic acid-binding protein
MASIYTVDASVFLNAFNSNEKGHEKSKALLARFQADGTPMIIPTLCLVEVGATVRRGRGDEKLAREFTLALRRLPHLILIPLDETLTMHAIDLAVKRSLRGSDAVYVATAWRFGAALVTLDQEQHQRGRDVIETLTPEELLESEGGK